MKLISCGIVLLAIAVARSLVPPTTSAAEWRPPGTSRWEYRVLTKEQVIELGKKDLAAGLNQLGDDGWELVAVDGQYIFKRPKDQERKQLTELKHQVAVAEADVAGWKDRVAWAERMVKKGYLTDKHLQAERAQLTRAEMALDLARRALENLTAGPKRAGERESKPEK
jgi:hypothetical protein